MIADFPSIPRNQKQHERTQLFIAKTGLSWKWPSKRTGYFAQNEPPGDANPPRNTTLSRGWPATSRVAPTFRSACRTKARRSSRRGSGEGSPRCGTHTTHTQNKQERTQGFIAITGLKSNEPSKRTSSLAKTNCEASQNPSCYRHPPRDAPVRHFLRRPPAGLRWTKGYAAQGGQPAGARRRVGGHPV
jgi:hypothetical protein